MTSTYILEDFSTRANSWCISRNLIFQENVTSARALTFNFEFQQTESI